MIPNQKTHVTTQATRRGSHGRGGAAQRTNGTSAAANSGNNNNNSNQGAEQRALFLGRSFYLDLRSAPEVRKNIHFGIEALKGVSVCVLLLQWLNHCLSPVTQSIENFLSPEVKYVVTDRPDDTWPKRDSQTGQQSSQQAANGGIPAAMPAVPPTFAVPVCLPSSSTAAAKALMVSPASRLLQCFR